MLDKWPCIIYVGHMAMYYCMLDIWPYIIVCWTYGHVLLYVGHMAIYHSKCPLGSNASRKSVDLIAVS
jgi:hypothetical protein